MSVPTRRTGCRDSASDRRGISLLEVIVGTMLVAVLIVPLAGVIRASGQAIEQSKGSSSVESEMRLALRWLADAIRDGSVTSIRERRLQLLLRDGRGVTVRVQSGSLVMIDGTEVTPLADNVVSIFFAAIRQSPPPSKVIGISMSLTARDVDTDETIAVEATVSVPPQA